MIEPALLEKQFNTGLLNGNEDFTAKTVRKLIRKITGECDEAFKENSLFNYPEQ